MIACFTFKTFLLSGYSSIHCGERALRGHRRDRTVAANGGEAGGGKALLAVYFFHFHFLGVGEPLLAIDEGEV